MAQTLPERFIDALHSLEADRNLDEIVALFSDDCEVGNIVVPEKFHGKDGARQFWTKYRDTFETLQSSFRNTIETNDRAALEWTTEAKAAEGESIHYEGVSLLEFQSNAITRFRAYFNAGDLGRQLVESSDTAKA